MSMVVKLVSQLVDLAEFTPLTLTSQNELIQEQNCFLHRLGCLVWTWYDLRFCRELTNSPKQINKKPKCDRFLKSRIVNPCILRVSCCVSVQYKPNCNYFLFMCAMPLRFTALLLRLHVRLSPFCLHKIYVDS